MDPLQIRNVFSTNEIVVGIVNKVADNFMTPANTIFKSDAIKYFRPELLCSKNSSDE
jgi:hypothetical protein